MVTPIEKIALFFVNLCLVSYFFFFLIYVLSLPAESDDQTRKRTNERCCTEKKNCKRDDVEAKQVWIFRAFTTTSEEDIKRTVELRTVTSN